MSIYFDLAQLSNDETIITRIGYACSKYAAYILGEPPTSFDHAARQNWALKVQGDPRIVALSLAKRVCQDPKVVTAMRDVVDDELQLATEAAANVDISVAITYVDLSALSTNPEFLRRVRVAIAKFCVSILSEEPTTANHSARYAWAKAALTNTLMIADTLSPAVVMDPAVSTSLMGVTDIALQGAVEKAASQLLL